MSESNDCQRQTNLPALAELCTLHQSADALLRSIYTKKVAWSALPTAYQQKMRCAYATVKDDWEIGLAWQSLLNHLGRQTEFVSVQLVLSGLGPQAGNTYLDALLHIALRRSAWRRPLEDWQPETPVAAAQFGSLVRHLFADYYVPPFLDAGWFAGFTPDGEARRDWFLRIGDGRNIRTADLPTRLTSRAAHHFLQSPPTCTIVGALRRGQTLALGGEEELAEAIAATRMGEILPDEDFWHGVVHFFVNNQAKLNLSQVGPIVDFIWTQKFGEDPILDANGQPDYGNAPEPTFSMKGRTLPALLERVAEWHEILARDSKRPRSVWEPTGMKPFAAQERDRFGTDNEWRIVELLSSTALMEEGRQMRHCVYSYAPACLRGATSIWSLRARAVGETRWHRLLTIEVNNQRRAIVQARGRCNLTLGAYRGKGRMSLAGDILRRWAREQKLGLACSL